MGKIISARQAVDLVKDGDTLALNGFLGFCVAEDLLVTLEETYLRTGHPKNLQAFYAAGIGGDGKFRGANHLAQPGMLRRLYCGNNSATPKMAAAIATNDFPAYMLPQGVISHQMRAVAGGKPGVITHVGLKTFCDPRVDGCAVNAACKTDPEGGVVELITLRGKEYLFYPAFPLNICFLRGTTADEFGNVTLEHEAIRIEQFELAAAVKNSGGTVVVQVERVVERGSLNPDRVVIPGALVDYIVVGQSENCRQHYDESEAPYVPSWTGECKTPLGDRPPLPLDPRKVCARRGLFELKPGGLTNLGIGMPTMVSQVASEEGLADQVILSIESGATGGVPAGGLLTGASYNPEALLKQPDLFDLYDGGGIDVAYLGLAQVDRAGNVNVSKFSGRVTGPGGFVNITQNAKKVCFLGTFTAGRPQMEVRDGALHILKEGSGVKFVEQVEQITFSGEYSRENGRQQVLFITERAVFRLEREGLVLIELAPGVELERDVLAHMAFTPRISPHLTTMDPRIFAEGPMALAVAELERRASP